MIASTFYTLFDSDNYNVVRDNNTQLMLDALQRKVIARQQTLIENKLTCCAIYHIDTWEFIADFLASLYLGLDVVLPGSNTPELTALLDVDGYLGEFPQAINSEILSDTSNTLLIKKNKPTITIFTSGSTGGPKKISKKLEHLISEINTLESLWGGQANHALFIASVSHQHIYGLLFKVLWPLLMRREIWRWQLSFEENLVGLAQQFSTIVFISSPAFLKRLSIQLQSQSVVLSFSSGGVLSDSQAKLVQIGLNTLCYQVLGSSETGGIAWKGVDKNINENNKQSIWYCLPNVEIKINKGALYVKSPHCYQPGWNATGDGATLCQSGFLLTQRLDQVVKIEEKRVSLAQIENILIEQDYIDSVKVIALENNHRQYLVAAIVLSDAGRKILYEAGQKSLNLSIKSHLLRYVDPIVVPKQLRYLNEFPVNTQGKIEYNTIKTLFK